MDNDDTSKNIDDAIEDFKKDIDEILSSPTPKLSSDTKCIPKTNTSNNYDCVNNLSVNLGNLNNIREQLLKLDLNPAQKIYFDNSINPLLIILYQLSTTSYNLASSCNLLATSIIVPSKNSRIKDTVHLVYRINDECEDLFSILRKRINILLDIDC